MDPIIILQAGVASGTVLLFATIGEIFAERSGVLNLGVEGMMLVGANVLILDEPTNHLDLESITALNEGLMKFKGTVLFSSHDHQFIQTVANRIIEITPSDAIDIQGTTLDAYLDNPTLKAKREALYQAAEEATS